IVIDSADVAADRARREAARTRLKAADAALERTTSLNDRGVSSSKEVLAARTDRDAAASDLAGIEARLAAFDGDGLDGGRYRLRAPIGGTVVRRDSSAGKLVAEGEALVEIVDTSVVWAELDVAETDLARVAPGSAATLVLDAMPGREFSGVLATV